MLLPAHVDSRPWNDSAYEPLWSEAEALGMPLGFNAGTGRSQSFNDVARAVIAWHGKGKIKYIPFPDKLKGSYQSFTEASVDKLRAAGYDKPFHTVEQGVKKYLDWLHRK